MPDLSPQITPYKRLVLIATIIGVISGFGALIFYEGLKLAMAFFWGDLLGYVYPREGQSISQIAQWSLPSSLLLLLPILILGSLISGILLTSLRRKPREMAPMRQSRLSIQMAGYGNASRC